MMSRTVRPSLRGRADTVRDLTARARRVLHVGCADWPYTTDRLRSHELLHTDLAAVATSLIGTDLSLQGLSYLRDTRDDWSLVLCDVGQPLPFARAFDLIVCGEVLEHLEAPGLALRRLADVLTVEGTLLVTVPNALSFKSAVRAFRGRELVHPDHVAYYSPAVLTRLAANCGLRLGALHQYLSDTSPRARVVNAVIRQFVRLGPLGDGLIAELHHASTARP